MAVGDPAGSIRQESVPQGALQADSKLVGVVFYTIDRNADGILEEVVLLGSSAHSKGRVIDIATSLILANARAAEGVRSHTSRTSSVLLIGTTKQGETGAGEATIGPIAKLTLQAVKLGGTGTMEWIA